MSTEKSAAMMIRIVDFSESSCVITMMTRDFGKISALAKGARRPKGPFESAIDLLSLCRVVFIHKPSESLDLLTEAKLERRFRAATRDLGRLYGGYYLAELLNALTDEADPHPDLFDAAVACWTQLNGEGHVPSCMLRFELTALRQLGHLPSWETCAGCGGSVPSAPRIPVGVLAGGVLCPACRGGQRQVIGVRPEILTILRDYSTAAEPESTLPSGSLGELRGLLNRFLANLLGRPPRMHHYLGSLASDAMQRPQMEG